MHKLVMKYNRGPGVKWRSTETEPSPFTSSECYTMVKAAVLNVAKNDYLWCPTEEGLLKQVHRFTCTKQHYMHLHKLYYEPILLIVRDWEDIWLHCKLQSTLATLCLAICLQRSRGYKYVLADWEHDRAKSTLFSWCVALSVLKIPSV